MNYQPPSKDLPPGSPVFLSLRDSGGDKQEKSIEEQLAEAKKYCDKYGLIIVDAFKDEARTGTTTAGRDEFDRMIELCRKTKRAKGAIVWNYARFARNYNDSVYFKADLRRRGIIVHSMTDQIPEGPYAQFVEAMIDLSNEEKAKQTSCDSKRGLAQHVQDGYSSGGTPPRGYKAVPEKISSHRDGSPRIGSKWEIDPELGPLVTMAFKMRAEERSLNEIMKAPCGKLYKSKGCWVTFFRNKSYLGIGKCGELEVPNHHPPLIDQETFDKVQEIQKRASHNTSGTLLHPRRLHSPSLLSGIAVCIHCGTPVAREVAGPTKWKAYVCGKKRNGGDWHACEGKQIQAANADKAVINAVLNQILTRDYVTALLDEIRTQMSDTEEINKQEQIAQKALSACERAINHLLDTIVETNSPAAKERLKEQENERSRLQFELSTIEGKRNAAKLDITPEAIALVLNVWRGEIETARDNDDIRALQNLLRLFVTKIELGKGIARVWYTYPLNAFAEAETRLTKDLPRGR